MAIAYLTFLSHKFRVMSPNVEIYYDELIQRITVLEARQHNPPTPPSSSSAKTFLTHTPISPLSLPPPLKPTPSPTSMPTSPPRSALTLQHPASLLAPLTSRGDTIGKLVAPPPPTLPFERSNNIHLGARLPLNVLNVGSRVPQTILRKVLKDFASPTANSEFHNVLHVTQHHLVPLGSFLASLSRPWYSPPSPPPPPPKPPSPPPPRSVRVSPLHISTTEGLYFRAKLLFEGGASVFTKDRWRNTPLDEAQMCGNKNLIKLLEDAQSAQRSEFPSQEYTDENASEAQRTFLLSILTPVSA